MDALREGDGAESVWIETLLPYGPQFPDGSVVVLHRTKKGKGIVGALVPKKKPGKKGGRKR